ncbi:hypothetical protein HDV00_001271 [Rhizophlyctis rosea]|nr:hypothetical protein HDV00_001271 [Rhizophlyctis rosea]
MFKLPIIVLLTALLGAALLPHTASSPTPFHTPSSPIHLTRYSSAHHVFRRQSDTCNQIFAAGSANPAATNQALTEVGDSWLQAFGNPITGFLCSFSVGIVPAVIPAIATLTLYSQDVSQQSILQGLAVPFATVDATTSGDRLVFNFCGETQAPLTEGEATTFVVTLSVATGPLFLLFDQGEGTGVFFGPSISGGQTDSISQSLTFNITTSDVNPVCPSPSPTETTTTVSEAATSSSTSTTEATSTSLTSSAVTTTEATTTTNELGESETATSTTSTATPTSTCAVSDYKHGFDNCTIAENYTTYCIKSFTLSLCYQIACIYNKDNTKRYIERALYQCAQHDYYARLTSATPGVLPKNY